MSGAIKELDILKQLFENLSDTDKQAFLNSVSQKEQVNKLIGSKKITNCPHCQSIHFVKNGKDCDNQRYLCRDCKKSFVEQTGTILFGTQKGIEVWERYIHCMIEKYPLRKCAEICNINLATAFAWRHKILDALQSTMNELELEWVVQADENYYTISDKENNKNFNLPRSAHKRGMSATKRSIYKEQICVPCGINLDEKSVARISNLGKPSLKKLQKVLNDKVARDSAFVTNSLRPYQKLSLDMNLSYIHIPHDNRAVSTFNIQTINSYPIEKQ